LDARVARISFCDAFLELWVRFMPPVVIDLRSADDRRDVVHRAVQSLAEGGLVAFPTETVYGVAACALQEGAVERLMACKDRTAAKPLALAIKSADEALDYAPDFCPLAGDVGRDLSRWWSTTCIPKAWCAGCRRKCKRPSRRTKRLDFACRPIR